MTKPLHNSSRRRIHSSDPPVHTRPRAKNSVLGPVTQVEEDVERIQTLLKETFYFNYLIDDLISYFTLVFTFICLYIYKRHLRTMYHYSEKPFWDDLSMSVYIC